MQPQLRRASCRRPHSSFVPRRNVVTRIRPRTHALGYDANLENKFTFIGTINELILLQQDNAIVGGTCFLIPDDKDNLPLRIKVEFVDGHLARTVDKNLADGERVAALGKLKLEPVEGSGGGVQAVLLAEDLLGFEDLQATGDGEVTYQAGQDASAHWQAYFQDPSGWRDNRAAKLDQGGPDFVHKETGVVLHVADCPAALQHLVPMTVSQLWDDLRDNPQNWYDNRDTKTNPKAPDFKHIETKAALWVDSRTTPEWVETLPPNLNFRRNDPSGSMARAEREAELWQEFFKQPTAWFDNRFDKRNPRAPDFKKKGGSGEALWLNSAPSWVQEQLQLRGANSPDAAPMTAVQQTGSSVNPDVEQKWNQLFADPGAFWDNRARKMSGQGNPRAPDFTHKTTKDALWLDGRTTPQWVHERIEEIPVRSG